MNTFSRHCTLQIVNIPTGVVTLKKEADRKKLHENMLKRKCHRTEEDFMSCEGDDEQFVKNKKIKN